MWHQQLFETRQYHVDKCTTLLKGLFIFVFKELGEVMEIVYVIRYARQPFVSSGSELII